MTYPTLTDAITSGQYLAAYLRSNVGDRNGAINAAYTVIGYGLSVSFPAGTPAPPHPNPTLKLAKEDLIKHLQELSKAKDNKTAGPFPWQNVLAALLGLLSQWLTGG